MRRESPKKGESGQKGAGTSVESGIKKQYLRNKPMCKATFKLPREAAPEARTVCLVGDFNNWNARANPMKRAKDGSFSITLELPCDREYKYKYLIDNTRWENDWSADRYESNPYGGEDSVLVLHSA